MGPFVDSKQPGIEVGTDVLSFFSFAIFSKYKIIEIKSKTLNIINTAFFEVEVVSLVTWLNIRWLYYLWKNFVCCCTIGVSSSTHTSYS